MRGKGKLEFGKLLGFETIVEQISSEVDFGETTIAAKLGVKVGGEPVDAPVTGFKTRISDES